MTRTRNGLSTERVRLKSQCEKRFLGGIRGQLAGLTRLLFEEAAELTTGGFKGALLLLRVAVIQQRPFLLENIEDESFNWRFSQRRGFIQVADDFPAQYPEIVDVLADSFLGKIQPDEVLDEGSKVRHHLLTRGNVFRKAHPTARPLFQVLAARSEERRVGKECRSRWWPDRKKKKT